MSRVASTTVGVIIGGAVGAVAALMLAPKAGSEIRSDVWNWTKDVEHKAADKVRGAGSSIASGIRQVPGVVSEKAPMVASKVKSLVGLGSEQANQVADQVENASEQASGQIHRQADRMSQI